MKNTQIALIVYSITDKNSYDQLSFWINQVKEVNKDKQIIFGIAANKSDLFEEQLVSKEEGEKFAKEKNLSFFETSAKDHGSIDNVFMTLTKMYLEKHKKNNNSNSSLQVDNGKNIEQ